MDTQEDQQFLETVVTSLVDHPDSVQTNRTVDEMGVLLTLDVHAEDMGKIIGRSGNTAKAIRTLLRVVGMKHDARVNLKINEPEGGKGAGGGMSETGDVTEVTDDAADASGEPLEPKSLDQAIDDLKI
ncbi:MAG: putative RNA-binding protein YlqC (UPF0109 family) [Candidatus Azotimanducaceae bacterium]|jgi:predicted RNA-binding protein YlqC (UPF0109 family)